MRASVPPQQMVLDALFIAPATAPATQAGALDISQKVRRLLSDALTATSRSTKTPRPQLAEQIGTLAGRPVTPAMLDRYAAASCTQWRLPAETLPAIVEATGDRRLLELLVETCGGRVLWGDEVQVAELGALAMQERLARARRLALSRGVPASRQAAVLDGLRQRLAARGGR